MDRLLETGIPIVDAGIGGFLQGRTYMVIGEPGTGKSLLGLHYLAAGIRRGEPGLLLTQERPVDLLDQSASMGLDLERALDDGTFVLLEYDRDVTGTILRYGWKSFLDQLEEFRSSSGVRRIVFDTIFPLFAANMEEGRLRSDLRYFVDFMQQLEWTPLLLVSRDAMKGHAALDRAAADLCAGVLELAHGAGAASGYALVWKKLRQPREGPRSVAFQIERARGFVRTKAATSGASAGEAPTALPRLVLGAVDRFLATRLARKLEGAFEIRTSDDASGLAVELLRDDPGVVLLDRKRLASGYAFVRKVLDRREAPAALLVLHGTAAEEASDPGVTHVPREASIDEIADLVRAAKGAASPADTHRAIAAAQQRVPTYRDEASLRRALVALCRDAARYGSSMAVVTILSERTPVAREALRVLSERLPHVDLAARTGEGAASVVVCDQDRAVIDRAVAEVVVELEARSSSKDRPSSRVVFWEAGSGVEASVWDVLREFHAGDRPTVEGLYAKTGTDD